MAKEKDRVGQMRENFESKYGSPTGSGKVLIGMKGGRAVYGDELDEVDPNGEGVINNTYSQNQAIMDGMFKEMGRSGGMYNPSTPDIRRAEQLSPPTEADYKVTTRADGKKMVGAYSPEAAAMRESSNDDARFLQTLTRLNARPNRTSAAEPTRTPPPDLRKIAEEDRARESSPFTSGPFILPKTKPSEIGKNPLEFVSPPIIDESNVGRGLPISTNAVGLNNVVLRGNQSKSDVSVLEDILRDIKGQFFFDRSDGNVVVGDMMIDPKTGLIVNK